MNLDLVNIILGMKIRQARTHKGLTLTELAERAELSPSYVTEIEKGRKYPKADKIMKMAAVLDTSYDELVSVKLAPALDHLETVLSSPLLHEFPFAEFGLEAGDLVNLLTRVPAKASALLHAMLEIGRQHNLKDEHFLRAALRSYQELHENYFPELEEAAIAFSAEYELAGPLPFRLETLQQTIKAGFGYRLEWEQLAADPRLAAYRSVLVEQKTTPTLLLNRRLHDNQIKFLLLREMGYRYLELEDRAYTSAPDEVSSFQQVLNDFKASYFAGAVLMPRAPMIADLRDFFNLNRWQPGRLLQLLHEYDVTPEMLLYRFSELVPQFFDMPLHFLRFHSSAGNRAGEAGAGEVDRFRLVKQLNMNRLRLPSGSALSEHFCRRWLTVRLLRELQAEANWESLSEQPLVGAQISQFHQSGDRFLCLGFARPLVLSPDVGSSVIVGFRVDETLTNTIRFAADPHLPRAVISGTCERCPLTPAECQVRAVPPTILQHQARQQERQQALQRVRSEIKGAS